MAGTSSCVSKDGAAETEDIPADANELRRRRLAKLASGGTQSPEHEKDE